MPLQELIDKVKDPTRFTNLRAYICFCKEYLNYVSDHLYATIVPCNEQHYHFFQYGKDGNFQITRPINSRLMYTAEAYSNMAKEFLRILQNIKTIDRDDHEARDVLNRMTYTIQQSIGATIDGIPDGQGSAARKLNNERFENLIRLILHKTGINCRPKTIPMPVKVNEKTTATIRYQHSFVVENNYQIQLLGAVRTSSKEGFDKTFLDRFMCEKLAQKTVPHIAIFLNDVNGTHAQKKGEHLINTTFMVERFKGYTTHLTPFDGFYYCDIRPVMLTDDFLKTRIKTFDCLLIDDIWKLIP